jgi:hypothetical protein
MSQALAREFFSQGGVDGAASPYVLKNMGRYTNLSFKATTVSLVEGSVDGGASYSALTGTSISGGVIFSNVCFMQYRVTFTGSLFVNAN